MGQHGLRLKGAIHIEWKLQSNMSNIKYKFQHCLWEILEPP